MLKSICTMWINDSSCVKQKVNDCVQHIILQKFTNFHAIRSWSFRNICNEIGWPRLFCATLYTVGFCGQEAAMLSVVISLQMAAQKAILACSHDVQPSESAGHVFLFVNTVRSSHLAAQRSTLAYMEHQSPAELRSLDVSGRFTSEH